MKILTPVADKILRRYTALCLLPTSLMNKLLILAAFTWNYLYFMETFDPRAAQILAQLIDRIQEHTFYTITGITESPDSSVRIFTPAEDGGFGLIPYIKLQPWIYQRCAIRSKLVLHSKRRVLQLPPVIENAYSFEV